MSSTDISAKEAVTVSCADHIGRITLNRPGQINAINDEMRKGLPAALEQLDSRYDVKVIVIDGAGPRGFCVGADIHEFRDRETVSECRARLARNAWTEAFDRVAKPLIAAIHGYCFGGGMEIALACDFRMASPGAFFALPEVGLGLIPGAGATQRLPRLIGFDKALDMLVTGERVGAAKALELGMITRLCATEESLIEEAMRMAAQIATKPATAVAYCKEAARRGLELPLSAGLALERDLFSVLIDTDERRAAVAEFKNRRK